MDWESEYVRNFVAMAVEQDRAASNLAVTAPLPGPREARAQIIANADCVCAGLPLIERIFRSAVPGMETSLLAQDGQKVRCNDSVMQLRGDAGAILKTERTALHVLEHLSGVTTKTRRFAGELRGTRAKVCGPRQTTPGLRWLEEYAIELGGGRVHRANDILVTSNHVRLAGGVNGALDQAHSLVALQLRPHSMTAYDAVGAPPSRSEADAVSIQIEVQHESELREALGAGAEFVILKNVRLEDARRLVQVVRHIRPEVTVLIAGEMAVANVRAYAETGADYLCCEELIHPTPRTRFNLLVERHEEK